MPALVKTGHILGLRAVWQHEFIFMPNRATDIFNCHTSGWSVTLRQAVVNPAVWGIVCILASGRQLGLCKMLTGRMWYFMHALQRDWLQDAAKK